MFDISKLKEILAKHRKWWFSEAGGERADLRSADLRSADLRSADLSGADLSGADLSGANLSGANLSGANLSGANLSGADLRSANLRSANLSGANLRSALTDEKTIFPPFLLVPEEGPFIGFKKACTSDGAVILTVYVPRSAKRINSPSGRKCRAEKVKVLKVEGLHGEEVKPSKIWSTHAPNFSYEVGKWVKPDKFDEDFRIECTSGIHFFITKKEAQDY